ncbi:MAG: PIN domain-containing protein [Alcanivorax sp.]|jgi:predicted nucleic acid-binding protein|nr:PIN domain-containing protein [Alcanivorax sp.]MBM1144621.1 PIN domain-containing protein [Alcanivorax sp. ZXX171]UWN48554.1 Putative ribonuclease VapC50 [Alcanivorax sp. ALC70]MAY09222.1 PIN domain-containing protein [Alcanivorax sp.]MBI53528.1 PIN domain-containing protein [Alcanivorax sp.]|tara:strand:+ start:242 stop:805 length:564 start_codon:yes stop_codon:yes gene_type:complete
MRFSVIYDACVLYPAPLRDFLIRLALSGLFAARWSDDIQNEWSRNLLEDRPELAGQLPRTIELMNQAVPDCRVTGYENLIAGLTLPDPDDRHVLAAAVVAGAQLIVTFNLRDFPEAVLARFGIEAVHPDDFVVQQFDLHEARVIETAKNHRGSLKKPPKGVEEYLETLAAQGLVVTVDRLREYEGFI